MHFQSNVTFHLNINRTFGDEDFLNNNNNKRLYNARNRGENDVILANLFDIKRGRLRSDVLLFLLKLQFLSLDIYNLTYPNVSRVKTVVCEIQQKNILRNTFLFLLIIFLF